MQNERRPAWLHQPWCYDEDGRAQVDRQGCALTLADKLPEKIGKAGLMFISLNVEPATREAAAAAVDALRADRGQGRSSRGGFVGLPAPGSR